MIQTLSLPQRNRTTREIDSKKIELLYHDEFSGETDGERLEDIRDNILDCDGQYISLDLGEPQVESLSEMLYVALKNARWERSLQFSLPAILQHNPRAGSLFINRAILWQRLCDLLIMDDDPNRETVLVLENIDQASPKIQHEVARLIRFHQTHSLHRKFVTTLNYNSHDPMIPELQNALGM
jgi:hypothetical protein